MEDGALIFRERRPRVHRRRRRDDAAQKQKPHVGPPKRRCRREKTTMRFTTHLEGFALRASARSKDRAIDTSSPQSTGDRHSMCAIRATATLTTTTKRRERERERKYRLLRCNTNNRKSSALSALFRVRRALEGVVVFLNIVSRRRRRRPIGFKRVKTPFPHPNYLGSQNRCVFSPKISPIFFSTKSARKKKSRHVLSSPPTRERVFPRRVFRFLVFVAIVVAVAHHHHQSFLGGVFSRRLCVDTIR